MNDQELKEQRADIKKKFSSANIETYSLDNDEGGEEDQDPFPLQPRNRQKDEPLALICRDAIFPFGTVRN